MPRKFRLSVLIILLLTVAAQSMALAAPAPTRPPWKKRSTKPSQVFRFADMMVPLAGELPLLPEEDILLPETEDAVEASVPEILAEAEPTAEPEAGRAIGDMLTLHADLTGYLPGAVSVQWQRYLEDQWQDLPGETADTLTLEITEENIDGSWRYLLLPLMADEASTANEISAADESSLAPVDELLAMDSLSILALGDGAAPEADIPADTEPSIETADPASILLPEVATIEAPSEEAPTAVLTETPSEPLPTDDAPRDIAIRLEAAGALRLGDSFTLHADLTGYDLAEIQLQWQCRADGQWQDVPGANAESLTLVLTRENIDASWRVLVHY